VGLNQGHYRTCFSKSGIYTEASY